MANDPRNFLVVPCDSSRQKQVRRDTGKKGFFGKIAGAAGKVGDIEGLGKVGEGLRVLNDVSESNRMGRAKSVINEYDVFDATSVDSAGIGQAAKFNPGVVNRAVGQAKQIAEKVNGGNFELSDIPESFSDIQNLGSLVRGIFPGIGQNGEPASELCGAEPYAMDLIRHAPKFKYMFVVQITFQDDFGDSIQNMAGQLAFVCKHSTRPTVEFEYEEVNIYNFRTRVPKRTIYPPITMRFYDDNMNSATQFQDVMMMLMSPVSNAANSDSPLLSREWLAANAMTNILATTDPSTASLGAYFGEFQVIKNIKLFQVYDYGNSMNVYTFHNPKILSITPDELDSAETGNGSEMEMQFAYDVIQFETDVTLRPQESKYNIHDISTNSFKAEYGINPIFSEDSDGLKSGAETPKGGLLSKIGKGIDSVIGSAKEGLSEFGDSIAKSSAGQKVSKAFQEGSDFVGSIFS